MDAKEHPAVRLPDRALLVVSSQSVQMANLPDNIVGFCAFSVGLFSKQVQQDLYPHGVRDHEGLDHQGFWCSTSAIGEGAGSDITRPASIQPAPSA